MKISEDTIKEAEVLQYMTNNTLEAIFDKVQAMITIKQYNLAQSYIKAITIDMLGKMLTFPNSDKQSDADYICKWIKHRYDIDIEIRINNESIDDSRNT